MRAPTTSRAAASCSRWASMPSCPPPHGGSCAGRWPPPPLGSAPCPDLLFREEPGCSTAALDGETRADSCPGRLVGRQQGQVVHETRQRKCFEIGLQVVDTRQDCCPRPGSQRVPAKPGRRRAMQEVQGLDNGARVGKINAPQVDAIESSALVDCRRTWDLAPTASTVRGRSATRT